MSTVEPLNTAPIQQFIQQVKAAENNKSREVKLTIEQAKSLSYALGMVMSRLHGDLEKLVAQSKNNDDEVIQITVNPNSSW